MAPIAVALHSYRHSIYIVHCATGYAFRFLVPICSLHEYQVNIYYIYLNNKSNFCTKYHGFSYFLCTRVSCNKSKSRHSINLDCVHKQQCSPPVELFKETMRLRPLLTKGLINYKADSLINIRYPEWSLLLQPKMGHKDGEYS